MTASQASASQTRRRTFERAAHASQYEHEVLEIARVVRVVKGGRRFRFRATVIVGDRAGTVGVGVGKSRDVQQAIQKAQDQASKYAVKVNLVAGTIPHEIRIKHKGAVILLKPARPGSGIIAGGTVRTVADLVGITDLVSKRFGSSNRLSNARAAIRALSQLKVSSRSRRAATSARARKS